MPRAARCRRSTSSPVSRITFRCADPHAALTATTSSTTLPIWPWRNAPRSITMSTSSAPAATASATSASLTASDARPDGKAVATEATATRGASERVDGRWPRGRGRRRSPRPAAPSRRAARGARPSRRAGAPCRRVSAPSSVVRSIIEIARSIARSLEVVLIDLVARAAARASQPTWSTPGSPARNLASLDSDETSVETSKERPRGSGAPRRGRRRPATPRQSASRPRLLPATVRRTATTLPAGPASADVADGPSLAGRRWPWGSRSGSSDCRTSASRRCSTRSPRTTSSRRTTRSPRSSRTSGVVEVPDARLAVLAALYDAPKAIPATVTFLDIAGIVAGASEGEGLGNQFLAEIRETDAICEVVRAFVDDDVVHVNGALDPSDDISTVETELILADLQTIDKALKRLERDAKRGALEPRARRGEGGRATVLDGGTTIATAAAHARPRRAARPAPAHREARASTSSTSTRRRSRDADARASGSWRSPRPRPSVVLCAKLEAEVAGMDPADAGRAARRVRPARVGPRAARARRLRDARAPDVPHRGPEGGARLDDPTRRDRARGRRRHPLGLRDALHQGRGRRLRRPRRRRLAHRAAHRGQGADRGPRLRHARGRRRRVPRRRMTRGRGRARTLTRCSSSSTRAREELAHWVPAMFAQYVEQRIGRRREPRERVGRVGRAARAALPRRRPRRGPARDEPRARRRAGRRALDGTARSAAARTPGTSSTSRSTRRTAARGSGARRCRPPRRGRVEHGGQRIALNVFGPERRGPRPVRLARLPGDGDGDVQGPLGPAPDAARAGRRTRLRYSRVLGRAATEVGAELRY